MKKRIRLSESDLHRVIRESVNRVLNESIDADMLCYGRDDLMEVAESIANELGDINIAEDLCDKMASAASEFVKQILDGGTYSYTPY